MPSLKGFENDMIALRILNPGQAYDIEEQYRNARTGPEKTRLREQVRRIVRGRK